MQNQKGAQADAANTEATAKAAAQGAETKSETEQKAAPPSLADDLMQLEKLNLMRAVMLRLQGGRHPNAEIDALLQRRLDLRPESFQGPYAIRLICSLMMIFLMCVIMWGLIWLLGTAMEWSGFIRLMSTGIATLLAAAAGIAVFHPASVPDEKQVKETIARRLAELKDMGASENPQKWLSRPRWRALARILQRRRSQPTSQKKKMQSVSLMQSPRKRLQPPKKNQNNRCIPGKV